MQQIMIRILPLLLLLASPSHGAPELAGSREALDHHASSAESGEHLQPDHQPLELEDSAEWSASSEILDDNHAWFQRTRRSLESKPKEVEDIDDLEAAESVVFMPAHLRKMKKLAFQDCRKKHHERKSWGSNYPTTPEQVVWQCNAYCCYPVVV